MLLVIFYKRTVLNCFVQIKNNYLNEGTGKAWARQRRAKLWEILRVNATVWRSVANVGALAPTGSNIIQTTISFRNELTKSWEQGGPELGRVTLPKCGLCVRWDQS